MKRLSTNDLLAGGLILVVVSIGLVLFISIRQVASVEDTTLWVDHTHNVLHHIRKLEQIAVNNQSGARGFVITGRDIFLQPLQASETSAEETLRDLKRLISDNPLQLERLVRAEKLLEERITFSGKMIAARKEKGLDEAVELVMSGEGKRLMDSLRILSSQMAQHEERLLAERRQVNETAGHQLRYFLFSILGLVFLLTVFAIRQVRKRLNEQTATERKFAALLDAAPDATVIVDSSGSIRMINQQVINLFGYDRSELVGQPVEILIPQAVRQGHSAHRNSFFATPKVRAMGAGMELHALKKDGKAFPVEISLSPIQMEEELWVSAAVRDITRRKTLENALKKTNEELEAFTYSVSHDLRAPLRGIIGFTTILEEEYVVQLDSEAKRIMGVIRQNTRKMGNLIDDLLAFSRTGRQELVKVPIDMTRMVSEVITEITAMHAGMTLHIDLAPLPLVKADRTTIQQVWINLLNNAVKYSSGQQEIQVHVGSYQDSGFTVFFVKDNGIGFDMRYKEKLFRVFQRLHSAEEFEGTGVGLALVEKIISRHGGHVWAEGEVGKGASFFFSLPD